MLERSSLPVNCFEEVIITLQVRDNLLLAVGPVQERRDEAGGAGWGAPCGSPYPDNRGAVLGKAGALEGTEAFREGDRHYLICKYEEIPTATAGKNPPRYSHGDGRCGFPPEAGARAARPGSGNPALGGAAEPVPAQSSVMAPKQLWLLSICSSLGAIVLFRMSNPEGTPVRWAKGFAYLLISRLPSHHDSDNLIFFF